LITGAASGIGQACAIAFADAGCHHLVLVDLDEPGLESTVKRMGVDPSRVTTHTIDIQNEEAVEKLVTEIPEKYGSLDYALNCAGVFGKTGMLHEVEMEDIDLILNINVRAQIVFCRAEVKAILASKPKEAKDKGVIINWSSIMGQISGTGESPAYVASKHAISGLTKSMASAYGINGIRTIAVAPGFIETGMTKDFEGQARDAWIARTPVGRAGRSEEIASVVVSLCSPASSFVNGAIVPIDGGLLAR